MNAISSLRFLYSHQAKGQPICRRLFIASGLCILTATIAFARSRKARSRPRAAHTLRFELANAKPQLILVPAVVRDKQGQAIGSLRQEDFTLRADGKSQIISLFAPNTYQSPAVSSPASSVARIPRRFLALYFDDLHLSSIDTIRATDEADHYLRTTSLPGIRVGVFTSSGATTLNFTGDLAQVHDALMAIRPHPPATRELAPCPRISDLEAFMIAEAHDPVATELAIEAYHQCDPTPRPSKGRRVNLRQLVQDRARVEAIARQDIPTYQHESRQVLAGLQKLADSMAPLPGEHSIVLISPGFLAIDLADQLDEIYSRAIHSDTIISAIDAGGYVVPPPRAKDPRTASRAARNAPRIVDMRQEMQLDRDAEAVQVLATFADNTGGVFVPSVSDLEFALRKADSLPSTYYVLGFWLFSPRFDGRYHRLQVRLARHPGLTLQARDGFYAPAPTPLAARHRAAASRARHRPGRPVGRRSLRKPNK